MPQLREIVRGGAHAVSDLMFVQDCPSPGYSSHHVNAPLFTSLKINRFPDGLRITEGHGGRAPQVETKNRRGRSPLAGKEQRFIQSHIKEGVVCAGVNNSPATHLLQLIQSVGRFWLPCLRSLNTRSIFPRAILAAPCSASFLFFPTPFPNRFPLIETAMVNLF